MSNTVFRPQIKRALNISDKGEYRCFVGGLSWSTSNRALKDAFSKFGRLLNAKVVLDKESGHSRGFGFITFDNKHAMDDAIEAMDGINLHGRDITVDKARPRGGSGRDYDGDHSRDYGRDCGPGGDCFKCGKPGHVARECLTEGGTGGSYGGRVDRYGGVRGSGGSRFGPERNGDRNRGHSRDVGRGGDRNNRDRSGLYECCSGSRKNKMSK